MTHKRRCLSSRGSGTASAGSGCSTMGYQSLHHRPRNAAWRPARSESDLKYETNGLNSPLEGCRTRRMPAAVFQPSSAAAHCQNRDTPFLHCMVGVRVWGETSCVRFELHKVVADGFPPAVTAICALVTTSKSRCKLFLLHATFKIVTG